MGKVYKISQLKIKKDSEILRGHWTKSQKLYIDILKPALDFILALLCVVLLLPLFLIISIAIKLDSKGPIFFKQERVGKNNKIFTLIKFRSMTVSPENECDPLKDIERMTKVGNILRKTSLDELPQLFNIIIGKMSFIGPRPLLVEYLYHYSEEQIKRHNLIPGISGWSQVNGRNAISWEEKFKHDVWYVGNISFMLDLKILVMTLWNVLSRKGINNSIDDTMPFFKGNNKSVDS